jgi:S-adenosylmethionine decarboxylase
MEKIRQSGLHLVGTLIDCDLDIINDYDKLYRFLSDFPKKINMIKLDYPGNPLLFKCLEHADDKNVGYTGVVVLYESHFSFHVWPEYNGSLDFDIFSCKLFDYEYALDELKRFFKGTHLKNVLIERGHYGAKVLRG